jgi:hypothetical protein
MGVLCNALLACLLFQMKLTLKQKCERRTKTNRTASAKRGACVKSIEHLAKLAEEKRSVYCRGCWGLLPAIVVMNMRTGAVYDAIKGGSVFEYSVLANSRDERRAKITTEPRTLNP